MKNIFFLSVLFLSTTLFSQTFTQEISSTKLSSKRQIIVKLPTSYQSNKEKRYPLIVVLDGEYLFNAFEGNLAYGSYWDDMPEVILVGITQNKDHERDDDSEFDGPSGLPINKGAAFFEFIAGELLPYLDQKYRVAPFKVIAGIDATAGFLNAFLYKEIPQFNGYISLSPELATGMEVRIPQRLSDLKQPVFYYQATADGDLKQIQSDVKLLDQNIKTVKNPMLNYKFDDFKEASHYSLVLHAIPSALYQIFAVYQPISSKEYQEKIVTLTSDYADYLRVKYETIENSLGIKMNVRLNDFKAIETAILKNEAYYEYEKLAQISGQQYPKSMLYDYHMGMYYEKKGEMKKALKNYQNAFMKEEIGDLTKSMLMDKAEDIKRKLPKKGLKGGVAKEPVIEETAPTETETPVETPTEEPKEEVKPK
jgi:uncharacterized protein